MGLNSKEHVELSQMNSMEEGWNFLELKLIYYSIRFDHLLRYSFIRIILDLLGKKLLDLCLQIISGVSLNKISISK